MKDMPRLRETLDYIETYQRMKGGVSPSLQEIAHGIGIRSRSHVFKLLRGLEQRGLIRRLPRRYRAIEVLQPNRIGLFKFDDVSKSLVPLNRRE